MFKKKSIFITFEGIEGSGKSYQSKKLYKNIVKRKLPAILTREPGGTKSAEKIRKVILDDYFYPDNKEGPCLMIITRESGYRVFLTSKCSFDKKDLSKK